MIRFEHVGMRYGVGPEALSDVSFELEEGSFHFLTGPSGAGKTSLLRLMYLGHRPSRGAISAFGEDLSRAPRARLARLRRRIGVVFQDFRLIDHLSARENVALALRIAGVDEGAIGDPVAELLEWVGLGRRMDAPPSVLSGGEKQRLAIARAVACRPRLLLADEPTGNIDGENSRRVLRLFEALNKVGATVVIATHDEGLVARHAHPRLALAGGRLTAPAAASGGAFDDGSGAHGAA